MNYTDLILPIFLQGCIYSLVVLAVYLSSRVIQFDDLTTEGSFGFGGAIAGLTLLLGGSVWLALAFSILGGILAGSAAGFLHTKLKINNLICGLIVTTALFSICLKLTGANLSLPNTSSPWMDRSHPLIAMLFLGGAALLAYGVMWVFLRSEAGLILKVVGSNPQMAISLGKNVDGYKIFGLAFSNSLTALAGALFVLWSGFFSITGNIGTLVIGLTGLILGEMIRPFFSWGLILGAILYQAIFAAVIELELDPAWNHFIKAALIVLLIRIKPNAAPKLAR